MRPDPGYLFPAGAAEADGLERAAHAVDYLC
jgi:hypothetical protein